MPTPSLNALRMFDAAARHLNFRLAAEELNLTQGAVAQQVRRLETDLGLRLFHRKARGLALTDIGQTYHGPVRRALAMDAAANGQGIALAPRLLVEDEIAQGKFVVPWRDTRSDQSGYHVLHPAAGKPNAAREAVLDWVLSEVA